MRRRAVSRLGLKSDQRCCSLGNCDAEAGVCVGGGGVLIRKPSPETLHPGGGGTVSVGK